MDFVDSTFEGYIASGGAIYEGLTVESDSVDRTILNFYNTKFISNAAIVTNNDGGGCGGALALFSETNIYSSSFSSNYTNGFKGGGAIFLGSQSDTLITGSTFTSNESTLYNGGAIAMRGVDLGDNSNGTLDIIDSNFTGNKAAGYGGAIYNETSGTTDSVGGVIYLLDSSFTNNIALRGAAIYNSNTLTVLNTDFDSNKAKTSEESTYAYGGAIYLWNASITFGTAENTDYSNFGNYATTDSIIDENDDANGGFLFLRGSASAKFDIAKNSSITIGNGTAGYDSIASYNDTTSILN